MAPSRNTKQKDEHIQLSQESNEGDDPSSDTIMVLMKKLQDDREKSRKKKEMDFLKKAQAAYHQTLMTHSRSMATAINEIQQAYDTWRIEEAASSDRIRNLWLAISAESARTKDIVGKLLRMEQDSKEHAESVASDAAKLRQQSLKEERHCIELIAAKHLPAS
ncbi:hypothetical protein FRB94_001857 [Tulasnella sp. JGI-2019a]|nr:hypothetical protein FRB94_001857 [Tulasnella sp. JGI-2019a]KAG9017276.1 hypothetical protein FRB93_007389 [Tulasnella sp. JGI-2019a]KAG9026272.1 hypothetical protein FRB95_009030 [Tulasnella sp. JGI-2019a]